MCPEWTTCYLAEREGFEPPIRLPVCRISSAVHSTTLPPLRRLPAPWVPERNTINIEKLLIARRAAQRRRLRVGRRLTRWAAPDKAARRRREARATSLHADSVLRIRVLPPPRMRGTGE